MRLTRRQSRLVVVTPTTVTITVATMMTPVTATHNARNEFHLSLGHLAVFIEVRHLKAMQAVGREFLTINHTVIAGCPAEVSITAIFAALFVTGLAARAAFFMKCHTFGVPRLVECVGFVFGKGTIAIGVGGAEVRRDFRVNFIPRDAAIAIGIEVGEAFLHEALAAGARALRAALRIGEARSHGRHHNHSQKGYLFHIHVSVRIAQKVP